MRFVARGRKVGGSVIISIPHEVCKAMKIEPDDIIELELIKVIKPE